MSPRHFPNKHRAFCAGVVLCTLMGMSSGMAQAQGLRDVKPINDGLAAVVIADEIRKACTKMSPRILRALSYIRSLESHAKALGYSDQEIEDFVDSKVEQARVKAMALDYLAKAGAKENDAETYCKIGRDEIAKRSIIGALLRAN